MFLWYQKIRRKIIQHRSYYTADFCLLCYSNRTGVSPEIESCINTFSQKCILHCMPGIEMFLSTKSLVEESAMHFAALV